MFEPVRDWYLVEGRFSYNYQAIMKLYNLALQASTAIIKVLYGNFSDPKSQELVLVKSKSIELYCINDK